MTRGNNVEEGGKLHQSRHFTEVLFHLWLTSSGQNLDMVEDSMAKAAIDACRGLKPWVSFLELN